jgi:hypothetical protein
MHPSYHVTSFIIAFPSFSLVLNLKFPAISIFPPRWKLPVLKHSWIFFEFHYFIILLKIKGIS